MSADCAQLRDAATTPPAPAIAGFRPRDVIAALQRRHERRCSGDATPDGRTIALVVEGGSMRGVYSAGGMLALSRMGFTNLFDRVYATSAGAMNASYFLSHQPDMGMSIYFDSLPNRRFLNPLRLWKIIDIDWLFERIITVDKPLDVAAVMRSPTRFLVTLMDRSGATRVVDAQRSRTPLLQILKAAVAAPVFYNRSIEVEGQPCMDGGLGHRIPLEPALADGCTDVLVLTTLAAGESEGHVGWWPKLVFGCLCARGSVPLRRVFASDRDRAHAVRNLASDAIQASRDRVNIALLAPEESDVKAWSTGRRDVLLQSAQRYERMVRDLFKASPPAQDRS